MTINTCVRNHIFSSGIRYTYLSEYQIVCYTVQYSTCSQQPQIVKRSSFLAFFFSRSIFSVLSLPHPATRLRKRAMQKKKKHEGYVLYSSSSCWAPFDTCDAMTTTSDASHAAQFHPASGSSIYHVLEIDKNSSLGEVGASCPSMLAEFLECQV